MFRLSRRLTAALLWIAIALLPLRGVAAAVMLMVVQGAIAQSTSANAPAPAAASASAPSERAKRDADKVFQMILLHSEKKPPAKAPAKEATGGATPAAAPAPSRSVPPAASITPSAVSVTRPTVPTPTAAPAKPTGAVDLPAAAALPAAPEPKPQVALPAVPAPVPAPVPSTPAPKLELVSSVEPEFPGRLVRTLGAGRVVVQFDVAADGSVTQVEAVQSSHKGLEPAALAAVRQWKFKPMTGSSTGMTELKFE